MAALTKEDIVGELRGAAEGAEECVFKEDSIPEAIDFMFDTYCNYDDAESLGDFDDMDEDEIPSKEEYEARVKKAKEELEETGAITDELIIDELSAGLDNNYDEIHEGGMTSSIGEIILEEMTDEDDDYEEDDDDYEEEEEDPEAAIESATNNYLQTLFKVKNALFNKITDIIDDTWEEIRNSPKYPKGVDDDLVLKDLCEEFGDLVHEWVFKGTGKDEYNDIRECVKARFDIDGFLESWKNG